MSMIDLLNSKSSKTKPTETALGFVSRGFGHLEIGNRSRIETDRLKEFRLALDCWNRAIEIGLDTIPEIMKTVEVDQHYALSKILSQHDVRQSISDFSKTIEIDPKFLKSYISRAEALAQIGDPRAAISDYTIAIQNGTELDLNSLHETRGKLFDQLNDYENAISDFTIVIGSNPEKISNFYHRANAFRLSKKFDLARRDYLKVIEICHQRDRIKTHKLAELASVRLKELPIAEEISNKTTDRFPSWQFWRK